MVSLLLNVQGVGAKVALSVLSTLKASDLAHAIAMRDKAAIGRANGVGPKVAERIVTELKDKAPGFTDIDPALAKLADDLDEKRAAVPWRMPSRRWSISAMASRRRRPPSPPPPRRRARRRTRRRSSGLG